MKLTEIGAAAVAVAGMALHSVRVMMAALFLFGVISALFGPIKYGILPDHLERKELPRANAWIEGGTFTAILGGTIIGGIASAGGASVAVFGPMMMALSIACWLASRYIPATGSAAPDLVIDPNILRSTWTWSPNSAPSAHLARGADDVVVLDGRRDHHVAAARPREELARRRRDRRDGLSRRLRGGDRHRLGHRRLDVEGPHRAAARPDRHGADGAVRARPRLDDLGLHAAGQADTLAAFFAGANTIRVAIDLAGLAIAGAFVIVPTFAAVQAWAPEDRRARVVAAVTSSMPAS